MDILIVGLVIVLASGFLGYIIGRLGHYYVNFWIGDPNWAPDHWIYGLILMIIGLAFFSDNIELLIFSFGAGVLISDLRDFCKLKFYGSDNETKESRKFWHID
ncbi:MAG: hypothetical protein WC711_02240 [Candidatus Staskawiczbacteria bacterium]|jgi:hypothetical protein